MSFKPPQSAINNAKRGLKLRQEWGRGGLSPAEAKAQGIDSGVTRARKISSGTVSEHDVRRMSAFNRHRKNYRPEKKMPDGGPTAGTIAWLLWGGTSGVNWAKKKSAAMNAETFSSDEFTEEETLEELYEDYLEELDTYGHDGPVMSKSEYGRYLSDMEDKTFEAPKICWECNKEWEYSSRDKSHSNFCHDCSPRPETFDAETGFIIGNDWINYGKGKMWSEDEDKVRKMFLEEVKEAYPHISDDKITITLEMFDSGEWRGEARIDAPISEMNAETFEAEDPDDPELLGYMVNVPVLHYYTVGPVEAYNREDAEDEVVDNWRYWRSTIDNNGDWGGPIWRYRGIDISEPEAYESTEYEAEYKTMRKDEIGQLVSATKACLDALNECLEDDGRFNMDEYDALWASHPILADLQSKRFEASGLTMPAGFQETDDYYSDDGAHIITAEIPFLAPKGYYISDMEFHDGHIEVIFVSEDNKTFDADWRDLPRDSSGRWMSKKKSMRPPRSPRKILTRKTPEEPKVSTYSRSLITLRDLSEQLQDGLGLEDFNSAYFTVQQMLDAFPGGDSDEARRALRDTIEDTALVLQYNEEIDYPTHIQIMADIYRESGTIPSEEYEDAVFNRLAFEDEFAAERRVKPNLPRTSPDYTYSETFGKNIVLLAEGLEKDRNSSAFDDWELKHLDCPHDWQDEELHVNLHDELYQITAYCPKCDATLHIIAHDNNDALTLPGRRLLEDFYAPPQISYAEDDEDEGPTVEDFFREAEKLFNKYGEFNWDSEQHDDGLHISCFLVPWNGADNFFQYDEDFSEYRDE